MRVQTTIIPNRRHRGGWQTGSFLGENALEQTLECLLLPSSPLQDVS